MVEPNRAPARVLFLCIHNSARSQMAEGLLKHLAPNACVVESAGFEPRAVLPEVIEAMRLIDIDISGAKPKAVFDLYREGRIFDYVVTVCDEATAEQCPIFPGVCERVHWGFTDPSAATGTPRERLEQVVAIRDEIRARLEHWLVEKRETGLLPRLGTPPRKAQKG